MDTLEGRARIPGALEEVQDLHVLGERDHHLSIDIDDYLRLHLEVLRASPVTQFAGAVPFRLQGDIPAVSGGFRECALEHLLLHGLVGELVQHAFHVARPAELLVLGAVSLRTSFSQSQVETSEWDP